MGEVEGVWWVGVPNTFTCEMPHLTPRDGNTNAEHLRVSPCFLADASVHLTGSCQRCYSCRGNWILPSSCLDKESLSLLPNIPPGLHTFCGSLSFLCVGCCGSCLEVDNGRDQDLSPIAETVVCLLPFWQFLMVVLSVKYIVDGNQSCPFFLFCVCLRECRNFRCESRAAWDPSEGCVNQPLTLQEATRG